MEPLHAMISAKIHYAINFPPSINNKKYIVTYWYLSGRQKVNTQGQCLTIIVYKHWSVPNNEVSQDSSSDLTSFVSNLSPPITSLHVIKFPRLSFSFLHTASEKSWSPWTRLCTTKWSLGGGLEMKTLLYDYEMCTNVYSTGHAIREMILVNLR